MCFNYGAFPQTWEDPSHVTPDTGCAGDNDPIDACEIGTKMYRTGSVVKVKVLGGLATRTPAMAPALTPAPAPTLILTP